VSLASSDFKANRSDIASSFFAEPGGAALSFQLGPPENGGMIEGSVHLRWSGATATAVTAAIADRFGAARAVAASTEPEEKVDKLIEQLPADQRTAMRNALQKQPASPLTVTVAPTVATGPQPIFRRAGPPATRSAADPRKAAKDKQWMQALCAAFGDNVPGAPAGVCASVK
jgi:hypothetical protein